MYFVENGTDRVIQPLSDKKPTENQEKKSEIGLQVQTHENSLTVADDTEKQVTSESATGEKGKYQVTFGYAVDSFIFVDTNFLRIKEKLQSMNICFCGVVKICIQAYQKFVLC